MDRVGDYLNKCRILRQIQSNKAQKYRVINAAQNIATVVVSSFLTFIGFSGTEKVQTYIEWFMVADRLKVEFAFNLLVFALFVLAILHLVFQFGKKQADAERAIVMLTSLSNEIEDLIVRTQQGHATLGEAETTLIRQKYETLLQVIPANSDKEFLQAKKDYQIKESKQPPTLLTPQGLFDDTQHARVVGVIVHQAPQVMQILHCLREVDSRLFLGGGIVRNLVWDYLHGFKTPTPVDDVDVVYFDVLSVSKEHDQKLEGLLHAKIPNLRWSVKNQARMHIGNSDTQYASLEDAISKWPETATAIALRLEADSEVKVVAPHGFGDLFRLVIVPTPHFVNRIERVRERISTKNWQTTWPRLRVVLPPKA